LYIDKIYIVNIFKIEEEAKSNTTKKKITTNIKKLLQIVKVATTTIYIIFSVNLLY